MAINLTLNIKTYCREDAKEWVGEIEHGYRGVQRYIQDLAIEALKE
jgi:hypothetical protein